MLEKEVNFQMATQPKSTFLFSARHAVTRKQKLCGKQSGAERFSVVMEQNSKAVMILLSPKYDIDVIKLEKDNHG